MSAERDETRIVRSWLEDGVTVLPDRVLDAVLDQLPAIPQHRRPSLAERFSTMNKTARFLAAAAFIVAATGIGFSLLSGRSVGDVDASPTATPTRLDATSTPSTTGPRALEPGTHTTVAFQPRATFTVPEGWRLTVDRSDLMELTPISIGSAQLQACQGRVTAVDNSGTPLPDVGDTAQEILEAVAARTDLEVIQPPIAWEDSSTGLPGSWMEVRNPGDTELGLVLGAGCGNNLFPTGHNRFALLDVPDGSKILITIFTYEGTEAFIEVATPIAESLVFDLD